MAGHEIEQIGQPTPQQVAKDALISTPIHELAAAIPAQSAEDDEMVLNETLNTLELYSGNGAFKEEDLKDAVSGLFEVISQAVARDGGDINDIVSKPYEPRPGRTLRRSPLLPDDNHAMRLVSPWEGILELRTGPFHDDAVNMTYPPQLKVSLPKDGLQPSSDGLKSFARAIRIVADVFPRSPELIRDLNQLVGN